MRRRSRSILRLFAAAATLYLVLLFLDLLGFLLLPHVKNPSIGLRGLYVADPVTGYRLAPGWRGFYDDGVVRVRIETNSLGDRDDEPSSMEGPDILLVGASFAFGFLLDQSQTIDKQIDSLSDGAIDAYNLGVPGYGPPAILERLRRCTLQGGEHVFYLFFNNDLRDDNLISDMELTVVDGFMVPKLRKDGTPFTTEEHRTIVRRISSPSLRSSLDSLLRLRTFRRFTRLLNLRERIRQIFDRERGLMSQWGGISYNEGNVQEAFWYTIEMARLSSERDRAFHVVVLPNASEVRRGRHARLTEDYTSLLREGQIDLVLLLDRLTPADYHPHNLHLNRSGARKAAAMILEAIAGP